MTYVGCNYARERLEGFLDAELSVEEQIAVESHVRWCRTCAARIEDLQLIGMSLRSGSPALHAEGDVEPAVSALSSRVLLRLRAEQEEAFGVRFRDLFADMHLLWPALGATLAVAMCAGLALGVLRRASVELPESLATRLEAMANPGSELNPLSPDNRARVDPYFAKYVDSDRAGGISMPRVLGDGGVFESIARQDAMFTMNTVVNREGRIANVALIKTERTGTGTVSGARANDVEALLFDAVRQSRFAPALTPVGRAVAVNMVWLIVMTTVQTPAPAGSVGIAPLVTPAKGTQPAGAGVALPGTRRAPPRVLSPTA